MFCNHCGSQFPSGSRFCQRCGAAVVENSPSACPPNHEGRIHTLGILWLIMGGLSLIPSLFFMGLGLHGASFHPDSWDVPFGPMAFFFGIPSALMGLAALCAGWGLLHREPWARTAGIVVGILFLFHPPFGTLLGIFTLWALLSESTWHAGSQRS